MIKMLNRPKPAALLILEGFGYSPDKEYNAIVMADKPCCDKLQKDYAMALLSCAGAGVGLPDGHMGDCDMVGHIGIMDGADALKSVGGQMLITAEHGNIEQMVDTETGQSHAAHTTHPVPLTPTVLAILGVEQLAEMTGRSFIKFV